MVGNAEWTRLSLFFRSGIEDARRVCRGFFLLLLLLLLLLHLLLTTRLLEDFDAVVEISEMGDE